MKAIIPFLLALILPGLARAQQFDNPVKVPVVYYGHGNANGSASFSFGTELGAVTSGSASGFGVGFDSSKVVGYLIPGREYSVQVTSANCNAVVVYFQPVDGCEIYLQHIKETSYGQGTAPPNPSTFTFTVRVEKINDLTSSLGGKRGGQCSSFPEDKPIWYVGLGSLRNGRSAGAVGFRTDTVTPDLFTTSALVYDSIDPSEVSVTRDPVTGYITNVQSRDVVLNMTTISGTSYKIDCCQPATPTTPFITYTISSYASGTGIRIDKVEDGVTWSTALSYASATTTWTRNDWQLSSVFPAAADNLTTAAVSGSTTNVTYGSGSGAITKAKVFSTGTHPELLTSTMGSANATTYQYYSTSSGNGWAGAVQYLTDPSGNWTRYDYFNGATDSRAGQVQRIYHPWLDAPTLASSATTTNCYVETYDYAANYDGALTVPASKVVTILGTTAGKSTWTYTWSYATANTHTIAKVVRSDYANASTHLDTTTLAYREDDANTYFHGKLHAVTHPDNTKEAYAYFEGTWNPATNVFSAGPGYGARQMLVFHGQASSGTGTTAVSSWTAGSTTWAMDTVYLVANLSTVSEVIMDAQGHIVFTGENVYTSSGTIERIAGAANTYNGNNLVVTEKDLIRSVSGGDVAVTHTYSAGLESIRTDVDGSQTKWDYDNFLRNSKLTTAYGGTGSFPAKVQNFTYFSSGLTNTAENTPGVATTYAYDSAGRVTSASDPEPTGGSLVTGYGYNASGRQTTVTLPTNATKIADFYYDGKVKDQLGTGQVPVYYNYALESGGTGNVLKTTQHDSGATPTNGWVEEKTDWLGRTMTQRTPQVGWTSSSSNKVVKKTYSYSGTTGQLSSYTTIDESTSGAILPAHYYVYGRLAMLTEEGDDVDNSGGISDTSNYDRITQYSTTFFKETSGFYGWLRNDTKQVLTTPGSGTLAATIVNRDTRLTNFNGGALLGSDRVLADVTDTDASGRSTQTIDSANLSAHTRTRTATIDGVTNTATSTWKDGYLQTTVSISGVTQNYTYNAQGLAATATEGTTNATTTYNYDTSTGGNKSYLTSTVVTTGSASTATTSYTYTWNPATNVNSTTIKTTDAAGKVTYTEHNALGQVWHTWGSGVLATLVEYDNGGTLTLGRKTGQTTYQADSGGAFGSATWPTSPPTGNKITWHLDAATGATNDKTYANSSAVAFTYNARGQMKTRTWARGTVTTYNYFDTIGTMTGELQSVTYSDSTQSNTYTYTRFGAPATVVDIAGTRSFAYNGDLTLNTETLGTFFGSKVLTSNYDTLGRPTGWSFNGSATASATLGYDGATGRPGTVSGALGGTSTGTFTLGYAGGTDWVNSVKGPGNVYQRSMPLVSKYDVISGVTTTWNSTTLGDFAATYADARGWRDTQSINTSSYKSALSLSGTATTTFGYDGYGELLSSSSTLSNRSFSWTYDLAGNRITDVTNGSTTNYSRNSVNEYSSITGNFAEPGIAYDADGNLTQDGTWTYTYDAENRLKQMTKSGTTINFAYDYLGRRISKQVNTATTKFLWWGWSLKAEMDSTGYGVQKVFVRGPDFSDQQGNAGGAGALLAQIAGSTVSYAIPDVFGNIVAYATGSTITAAVEYSAYGKWISRTGSYTSYPIGYSGQYMDWETDLVYYGMRYYEPKHGRFINRDPSEEAGGNNLFAFVGNRPSGGWDVLGLDQEYDADGHPVEPGYVEVLRHIYDGHGGNYGYGAYGSSLAWVDPWVTCYSHDTDGFNGARDSMGIGSILDPRTGADITMDQATSNLYRDDNGNYFYGSDVTDGRDGLTNVSAHTAEGGSFTFSFSESGAITSGSIPENKQLHGNVVLGKFTILGEGDGADVGTAKTLWEPERLSLEEIAIQERIAAIDRRIYDLNHPSLFSAVIGGFQNLSGALNTGATIGSKWVPIASVAPVALAAAAPAIGAAVVDAPAAAVTAARQAGQKVAFRFAVQATQFGYHYAETAAEMGSAYAGQTAIAEMEGLGLEDAAWGAEAAENISEAVKAVAAAGSSLP